MATSPPWVVKKRWSCRRPRRGSSPLAGRTPSPDEHPARRRVIDAPRGVRRTMENLLRFVGRNHPADAAVSAVSLARLPLRKLSGAARRVEGRVFLRLRKDRGMKGGSSENRNFCIVFLSREVGIRVTAEKSCLLTRPGRGLVVHSHPPSLSESVAPSSAQLGRAVGQPDSGARPPSLHTHVHHDAGSGAPLSS